MKRKNFQKKNREIIIKEKNQRMEKKKGKCREVESKILSKIGERNIKEDREGK